MGTCAMNQTHCATKTSSKARLAIWGKLTLGSIREEGMRKHLLYHATAAQREVATRHIGRPIRLILVGKNVTDTPGVDHAARSCVRRQIHFLHRRVERHQHRPLVASDARRNDAENP